jgi:hypothetical protein
MNIWEVLGIPATQDAGEIRSAYVSRLRQVHPEDDPEGFQRLREAYDAALRLSTSAQAPALPPDSAPDKASLPPVARAHDPTLPSPTATVFGATAQLIERLLVAEPETRRKTLNDALRQEGWESLDFQIQLQRTLARVLLSNYERCEPLVDACAAQFTWSTTPQLGHGDAAPSELLARHAAREWRTGVESSNSVATRKAIALLRNPVDEEAFRNFAEIDGNVASMTELIKQLHQNHTAALRYEINQASVQWWLRELQSLQARRAQVVQQQAATQQRPQRNSFTAWPLLLFVLGLGSISRLINGNNVPIPSYATPGLAPQTSAESNVPHVPTFGPPKRAHVMGNWNATIGYVPGDFVLHKGSWWMARSPGIGDVPGISPQWVAVNPP